MQRSSYLTALVLALALPVVLAMVGMVFTMASGSSCTASTSWCFGVRYVVVYLGTSALVLVFCIGLLVAIWLRCAFLRLSLIWPLIVIYWMLSAALLPIDLLGMMSQGGVSAARIIPLAQTHALMLVAFTGFLAIYPESGIPQTHTPAEQNAWTLTYSAVILGVPFLGHGPIDQVPGVSNFFSQVQYGVAGIFPGALPTIKITLFVVFLAGLIGVLAAPRPLPVRVRAPAMASDEGEPSPFR
jgi:hypothetical protein